MWLRNVVCSVVTIAVLWGLGRGVGSVSDSLDARHSFGGLALFALFGAACLGIIYLIARAVDARAERQRGPMEPRR